jgi:uncharacterized phage protein gp47/JayE
MALVSGVSLFRSRDEIIDDLIAAFQLRIPDVYIGEDGVVRILSEVFAGVLESAFMANQVLEDDMFIQTASEDALDRRGDEYGLPRLVGLPSVGNLVFSGDGGTVVPAGTEVAYDPGTGADYLYFLTTAGDVIPNPGSPAAPGAVVNAIAGNLTGTYEYVITFLTAAGETAPGAESVAVVPAAQQVNLTAIPLGGAGTTGRRIYRQKNGSGVYNLVATLADNATVIYTDNIADGAVGGNPPTDSTAEKITIAAESEEPGGDYNVGAGAVTVLTNAPDGVTDVTNPAPFTGATDPEGFEDFRIRLLQTVRAPQTGSPSDLKSWAESVDGVESATVYQNDNEGTPTNGHVTIRIAGPGGSVPGSDVIDAVIALIEVKDIANVTIHVTTFTATSTNVSVSVTLDTGYSLTDVTPSVDAAISDYINSLDVGETLRVAGLYAAVFGLPGVTDVVLTSPTTNQATGATAKRTPGTLTVS